MRIDHITVAVPDLDAAACELKSAGLAVIYGGVHSTGKTHMSLCAFGDGSYLEVVAPFGGERAVPLWHDRWLDESGGSAWTIGTEDVGAEIARARQIGMEGRGPSRSGGQGPMARRVDGSWAIWARGSRGASYRF